MDRKASDRKKCADQENTENKAGLQDIAAYIIGAFSVIAPVLFFFILALVIVLLVSKAF